ncbi:hypothetical protein CXK86_19655 [Paenibacillus sp. BGI2013]|nr:hypothetical protein CXK86_19655 [Paenibacillus sp. BGI2013]
MYLAGIKRMQISANIITAILKVEANRGAFIGFKAKEEYELMNQADQDYVDVEMYRVLDKIFELEVKFTQMLYEEV